MDTIQFRQSDYRTEYQILLVIKNGELALIHPNFHKFRDYDKTKDISPKPFHNYSYVPDKIKADDIQKQNQMAMLQKGEYKQTQMPTKFMLRDKDPRSDLCGNMLYIF